MESPTNTRSPTTMGSPSTTGTPRKMGTPSYIAMERRALMRESGTQCRYFVFFNNNDGYQFHVYLICPDTGVYRFKLVKLHVKMSVDFPEVPPEVRFIHHTQYHIHPNFLVDGTLCLSLIGDFDHHDWKIQSSKWSLGQVCHGMLLYLRELLDDNPFKHQPYRQDKPELSHFVQYVTWDALLLRYIVNETDSYALAWLREYLRLNGAEMMGELLRQRVMDPRREYFTNVHYERIPADYPALGKEL